MASDMGSGLSGPGDQIESTQALPIVSVSTKQKRPAKTPRSPKAKISKASSKISKVSSKISKASKARSSKASRAAKTVIESDSLDSPESESKETLIHLLSFDIGIVNFAWCYLIVNKEQKQVHFHSAGVENIHPNKSTRSYANICISLVRWLKGPNSPLTLSRLQDCVIVCEQQVGRAILNRVLSMALLTWCHAMCDKVKFVFVGSIPKFALLPSRYFPPTLDPKFIKQDNYKQRKNASVVLMHHLASTVSTLQGVMQISDGLKKKDDLGDAFVQAFYYAVVKILKEKEE